MPINPNLGATGGVNTLYDPTKPNAIRRRKDGDFLARSLVKAYKGLPKGMHHMELLHAFNGAYPALDISPSAARLYGYLFNMTNKKDWHRSRLALVWPSNERIINDLNICDVSALKKLFKQLRAIGLIDYKDSPTRHRFGGRLPSGLIDYQNSYGIILNSIAGLYEKFKRLAEECAVKNRYKKTIARAVTSYRRERDELIAAAENTLEASETDVFTAQFEDFDSEIRESGRDYRLKEAILERYREVLDSLASRLAEDVVNPLDAYSSLSEAELNHMRDYDFKKPRAGGNNNPSIRTITKSSPQISNRPSKQNSGKYGEPSEPSNTPKSQWDLNIDSPPVTKADHRLEMAKISLDQVVTALPYDIKSQVRPDFSFYQVYDLLLDRCEDYGVSMEVFEDAVYLMGREHACACMVVIMSKDGKLRKPESYMRGLMQKYRDKALRIERSLFGIIAESKKSRTEIAKLPFDSEME